MLHASRLGALRPAQTDDVPYSGVTALANQAQSLAQLEHSNESNQPHLAAAYSLLWNAAACIMQANWGASHIAAACLALQNLHLDGDRRA